MAKDIYKTLEVVNHGDNVISVALARDHVRPEILPGTRQFLVEAISAKGGHHTLIIDVSQLTYEDMVHGLQYRNGLTTRNANSLYSHNPAGGNHPALITELRYLDNSLQLQAKKLLVAGFNETTKKMLHKAKINRQLTLKDTLEEAVAEATHSPSGYLQPGMESQRQHS
jgi:anti-anti-sigma regulatory factor